MLITYLRLMFIVMLLPVLYVCIFKLSFNIINKINENNVQLPNVNGTFFYAN